LSVVRLNDTSKGENTMQCLRPLVISVSKVGDYGQNIIYSNSRRTKINQIVPCGYCIACRLNYASEWAGRLYLEKIQSVYAQWVGLSYNEDEVPITNDNYDLCKKDVQDFLKRLRKKISLRYFIAGEYGGKTVRPHYHMLIFLKKQIPYAKLYKYIKKSWHNGTITCDDVENRHYKYVTKYLTKRLTGKFKKDFIKQTGLTPEFGLCSRKPFIGFIEDIEKTFKLFKNGYILSPFGKFRIHRIYKTHFKEKFPDKYIEFVKMLLKFSMENQPEFGTEKDIEKKLELTYFYKNSIIR